MHDPAVGFTSPDRLLRHRGRHRRPGRAGPRPRWAAGTCAALARWAFSRGGGRRRAGRGWRPARRARQRQRARQGGRPRPGSESLGLWVRVTGALGPSHWGPSESLGPGESPTNLRPPRRNAGMSSGWPAARLLGAQRRRRQLGGGRPRRLMARLWRPEVMIRPEVRLGVCRRRAAGAAGPPRPRFDPELNPHVTHQSRRVLAADRDDRRRRRPRRTRTRAPMTPTRTLRPPAGGGPPGPRALGSELSSQHPRHSHRGPANLSRPRPAAPRARGRRRRAREPRYRGIVTPSRCSPPGPPSPGRHRRR